MVIISSAYSNVHYTQHLHTNSVGRTCPLNFITEFQAIKVES